MVGVFVVVAFDGGIFDRAIDPFDLTALWRHDPPQLLPILVSSGMFGRRRAVLYPVASQIMSRRIDLG